MLDKLSLRIMNELHYDGRLSNVELAKKLGISAATVAKKINVMLEKGIIAIKAMPIAPRMGYHSQAFIGLSVDPPKIDSVCDRLADNIHVRMVTTCFGRFDILLIVFFQELDTLQDFIKGELPRIEGINHFETYFVSEGKKRNEGVSPKVFAKSNPTLIDELDYKIIAELIRDGRSNYADLANELGISKATVSRRIALLLRENIIRIIAVPNPSRLGYSANAYVLLNAKYAKIDHVWNQLTRYPEVNLIMKLINGSDILFGVYFANNEKLYEFLKNKIGNIDGIIKTETFILGDYFYFSIDTLLPPPIIY